MVGRVGPILRLANVGMSFGDTVVLRDLCLDVQEGEVVIIIGPSGSGKSTLLRCIAGLESIPKGEIHVRGVAVQSSIAGRRPSGILNKALQREVGMVFQHFNLFPHMRAVDNVSVGLRLVQRKSREEARAIALEELARVGLSDHCEKFPDQLSGGQQQRVAIARALAMRPAIMLFDEVTSALDPELVGEVLRVMRELVAGGMTMLVATHEMAFAREAGHRVLFVDGGAVIEDGKPDQVLAHPSQERTRVFLKRLLER